MSYLLSFLEVPLDYQLKKWENSKLKDNMHLTAEPLYKTVEVEFEKIIDIIKSDYRQYSPFEFIDGKKISDNWYNDNQSLIILDIDDGLSIAESKETFKEYKYLIATTKSHQIDKKGLKCDRFRIIMPAVNIPIGDDYFKAMESVARKYPFIDEQVNTKVGAFLGNADCEYWYNDGIDFDLKEHLQNSLRLEEVAKTFQEPKKQLNKPQATYSNEIDTQSIKSRLTRETVADIVVSCGFEVNRKFMFKYRPDERTPSASISPDLLIKDFGSDLSTDVIGFVQETKQMTFKESCEYVGSFVGITFQTPSNVTNYNDNIQMAVL